DLEANGPATVLGDHDELRKVIANLMRNAIVHTPAGTPIEVKLSSDNGDAVIEVRRQGPGGAGLGLAIVSAIVAAHGGSVSASNADGGGASFVVRLPERRQV